MYGLDWDGPLPVDDPDHVTVPETVCPLDHQDYLELCETVEVLSPSDNYGINLYLDTLDFVRDHAITMN